MHIRAFLDRNRASASRLLDAALIGVLLVELFYFVIRQWPADSLWLSAKGQSVLQGLSVGFIVLAWSFKRRLNRQIVQAETERIRQMQAMKSMFSVVKHELNNDMQVIVGNAELANMMVGAASDGGEIGKPVGRINEAATLAIEHIQELSVLSIASQATLVPFDLNALLRESIAGMALKIPSIVTVRMELEQLSERVSADRSLLSVSLIYLIRLAVKALQNGGEIIVVTSNLSAHRGAGMIISSAEIILVKGLDPSDYEFEKKSNPKTTSLSKEQQKSQFQIALEQAQGTTRTLMERCGAHVLQGHNSISQQSLIKIGFVSAANTVRPSNGWAESARRRQPGWV